MTLTEFWPNPIADRHAARSICLAIDVEGGEPTVRLQQSTCGIWGEQTFWTPLLRSDAVQCAILESQ